MKKRKQSLRDATFGVPVKISLETRSLLTEIWDRLESEENTRQDISEVRVETPSNELFSSRNQFQQSRLL